MSYSELCHPKSLTNDRGYHADLDQVVYIYHYGSDRQQATSWTDAMFWFGLS